MSYKSWSQAQRAGSEPKPDVKPDVVTATDQPTAKPDQKKAVVGPSNKT